MLSISASDKLEKAYPEDILKILLGDTRSKDTQRAYLSDLRLFFKFVSSKQNLTPELINNFLQLAREQAVIIVFRYKAYCLEKGLSEATINRRLAAIRALVNMGNNVGVCNYSLDNIKGEKVKSYRDTSGVEISTFNKCLALCNLSTAKGKRDYAMLHLLWSNALRRGEVAKLKVRDLDIVGNKLKIYGKGKGTQYQWVDLSSKTLEAINKWLSTHDQLTDDMPLFSSLHAGYIGQELTTTGIYKIVEAYFKSVTPKKMSPHRIRHSAITAALDFYKGDVRKVQKLSRHESIETLMIYDDNRQNAQQEVSKSLADMLE